ncbi:MAG: ArsC family reductase [Rhodocyclales bacterium]|nr:ArsC family reductase [Rhodocyclales bacterium]
MIRHLFPDSAPRIAMIKIYGIKNCDTMKKAFAWCDSNGIRYEFHDYKKQGVPRERLVHWCRTLGWQTLMNTRGPTWRKLTPEQQAITTQGQAVALMMEHSSVIRRPVTENEAGMTLVGFDPTVFDSFVR